MLLEWLAIVIGVVGLMAIGALLAYFIGVWLGKL